MHAGLSAALLLAAASIAAAPVPPPAPASYADLCEASAVAFLDADTFAVASDETNVLRLYRRGQPRALPGGVDLTDFTGFDKSDLEGAARIGDRIWWISSHSFNGSGEDKKKRKVLFATDIRRGPGGPTLVPAGRSALDLRDAIAAAAGATPATLNVEGLAAAPGGGLFIGLRAPLGTGARATVVTLANPDAVIAGAAPSFGRRFALPLGGLGIRDMTRVDAAGGAYLVAAGSVADSDTGYRLYHWSGADDRVTPRQAVPLRAEGVARIPGRAAALVVSDDGSPTCSDETTPPAQRRFRSLEMPL